MSLKDDVPIQMSQAGRVTFQTASKSSRDKFLSIGAMRMRMEAALGALAVQNLKGTIARGARLQEAEDAAYSASLLGRCATAAKTKASKVMDGAVYVGEQILIGNNRVLALTMAAILGAAAAAGLTYALLDRDEPQTEQVDRDTRNTIRFE